MSPKLEGAVTMGWSGNSNATNFAVGCKYALSKEASVRRNVTTLLRLGSPTRRSRLARTLPKGATRLVWLGSSARKKLLQLLGVAV